MGDDTMHCKRRLIGAFLAAAAAGGLLAGCAGPAPAGSSEPTETMTVAVAAPTTTPTTSSTDAVAASPGTTPSTAASTAASGAPVTPFVTSATWSSSGLDVGAVVPKVVESGGTCTAIAERDGVTVQKSGAAVAASSYTGCPQLLLTGADLVPGTWSVTVRYASDTSAGVSAPRTVQIG